MWYYTRRADGRTDPANQMHRMQFILSGIVHSDWLSPDDVNMVDSARPLLVVAELSFGLTPLNCWWPALSSGASQLLIIITIIID